jgi:hypothetical protein
LQFGSELLNGSDCDVEDGCVDLLGCSEVIRGYICSEEDVCGGFDIFDFSLQR